MSMSHANCDHPRTPAGRAACRKAGGGAPRPEGAEKKLADRAGVGRTSPKVSAKNLKRPGSEIKAEHDLGDMPRMLAHGCRLAWAAGVRVEVGPAFREDERVIIAYGTDANVIMTWRPGSELHSVSTRPTGTSIWTKRTSVNEAFRVAMGEDA